ncbi:putative ORFan [Cotonvirus japonicus]|uniref:ORFan n=1 Tax=Cotonvirus japonicus TaxID=2811091 RepID=A0ABM7NTS2_9VIRU|nr:putative ORFan [Cotonvirus japonicus]BCS83516.1 putative ORFan [Cotonvirus japonicus]
MSKPILIGDALQTSRAASLYMINDIMYKFKINPSDSSDHDFDYLSLIFPKNNLLFESPKHNLIYYGTNIHVNNVNNIDNVNNKCSETKQNNDLSLKSLSYDDIYCSTNVNNNKYPNIKPKIPINNENTKIHPKKYYKGKITKNVEKHFQKIFNENPIITDKYIIKLSFMYNIDPRKISCWFHNKKSKNLKSSHNKKMIITIN